MAFQNHKKHGGRVKEAAAGNAANTGVPEGFIPPIKHIPPDNITAPRASVSGYGQNSSAAPASIGPGATLESPMASALRDSVDDPLLDHLQKVGSGKGQIAEVDLGGSTGGQTRRVSDTPYKAANSGARSGGTVPATTGHSPMADEARRRAERLKG